MTAARTSLLLAALLVGATARAQQPIYAAAPSFTAGHLDRSLAPLRGEAQRPLYSATLADPNPPAAPITLAQLRAGFLHPPDSAKPIVRWWWFGAAVVKPEILRELQQMKADGIGGAELAFVYPEVLDDPSKDLKNLPFLSPQMLDAVRYAQTEGRRLGLRIDITLCSGWPYGGPATPLSEAATRLEIIEVAVPAKADHIPLPLSKWKDGDLGLAEFIVPGEPKHWNPADAKPLPLVVFSNSNDLHFEAANVPRVALFFIQSHTRQQVKRAAVGAEGYVLDPFSKQAVATHLAKVGEPLLSAFGSTPPNSIFSDSLEAYGADWTPTLPAEFLHRRGYDLMQHLPELVAGGTPAAEKVRHDYGLTLTELVNENYLAQINAWALAHHTHFRSQTYGTPAVSFSSQSIPGLAEGEGPQWRAFSTLRWASSANHVFGHAITSGETFTWLHSPVFRATPLDMKAEADVDFLSGENQLVFHGWPYSPPAGEVPEPGWSLYAAAALNDHNPWHPVMPAVTSYITRLSWLLRQGQPANQVAILLPTDDAWASFSPGHVSITDAMQKLVPAELISTILSAGYNIDFIDADAIDHVGLGTHQLLILPPTTRIPVETLQKLHEWAAHGGHIIALGHAPTLDAEGNPLPAATGSFLIANDTATLIKDMTATAKPDLYLLPAAEILPDLLRGVGFIRRKLVDADIYFVTNTTNEDVRMLAQFQTKFVHGDVIDPDTGVAQSFGPDGPSRMAFDLALQPYESRIFLFSNSPAAEQYNAARSKPVQNLTNDWHLHFTALDKTIFEPTLTDWTADPATLHYSGEGVYSRDFTLEKLPTSPAYLVVNGGTALPEPPQPGDKPALLPNGLPNPLITRTGPGMHAYFDPPIHEAALVVINGKPAGALWHPPYRLDVTQFLHTGTNHIELHVYNTALNAWSALPPHDYGPLKAKYGDRFQMQDLDRVRPIPSGILGTIQLENQWTVK